MFNNIQLTFDFHYYTRVSKNEKCEKRDIYHNFSNLSGLGEQLLFGFFNIFKMKFRNYLVLFVRYFIEA